jgi:hypothetical protein
LRLSKKGDVLEIEGVGEFEGHSQKGRVIVVVPVGKGIHDKL